MAGHHSPRLITQRWPGLREAITLQCAPLCPPVQAPATGRALSAMRRAGRSDLQGLFVQVLECPSGTSSGSLPAAGSAALPATGTRSLSPAPSLPRRKERFPPRGAGAVWEQRAASPGQQVSCWGLRQDWVSREVAPAGLALALPSPPSEAAVKGGLVTEEGPGAPQYGLVRKAWGGVGGKEQFRGGFRGPRKAGGSHVSEA